MDRILAILLGLPVAMIILKYRVKIKDFIGDVELAERYLGAGGTHTLIIIIAFGVFIGSLMYGMGTLQGVLQSVLGSFFA